MPAKAAPSPYPMRGFSASDQGAAQQTKAQVPWTAAGKNSTGGLSKPSNTCF